MNREEGDLPEEHGQYPRNGEEDNNAFKKSQHSSGGTYRQEPGLQPLGLIPDFSFNQSVQVLNSGKVTLMVETTTRYAQFHALHESGCFAIPNPWDTGSAKYLAHLGFKALATTSAGFAFSKGLDDNAITRDLVLEHCAALVQATHLPVNADFQSGYGRTPSEVAESVTMCVQTGVAGLSIEDATGDPVKPLFELEEALDRLRAAREAIDRSNQEVLLTGRAECFLTGHPTPLPEAILRLQAYAQAGADVLYAPGVHSAEQIRQVVEAVAPRPVNVLMDSNYGLKLQDLEKLGVRRASVGSALARSAWTGFIRAAKLMSEAGSFAGLEGSVKYAELNTLFEESQ